jgi:hypothetical protein
MPEPVSLLMRELLAWIASRRRTYAEALEAWRSSCPRHPVWDDAFATGLLQVVSGGEGAAPEVTLTPQGRAILDGDQTAAAAQPNS